MERSDGIKVLKFGMEKVWKMIKWLLKMCGNPDNSKQDSLRYGSVWRAMSSSLKD